MIVNLDTMLRARANKGGRRIVCLHSLASSTLSSERYEKYLDYMQDLGCEFCSLDEIMNNPEGGRTKVAITFDDGYKNNRTVLQPIMQRRGLHCTLFVATKFIGADVSNGVAEKYRLYSQHDMMDMRDVDEWCQAGLAVGFHSHCHLDYHKSTYEKIEEDFIEGMVVYSRFMGSNANRVFAYPFGHAVSDKRLESLLLEAGFRCAFDLGWSDVGLRAGMWRVPRVPLGNKDSIEVMAAKTLGMVDWYGRFRDKEMIGKGISALKKLRRLH
jgi:peptidoglycan/xylan/chitin deacetylase (PgdA/CDA1 family)